MQQPSDVSAETTDLNTLDIHIHDLKKAAMVLRSINHTGRQNIIKVIDEQKSITVTQLYIILRIEQSVASQHLAILRRAGIVTVLKVGKHVYYSINYKRLEEIKIFTKDLLGYTL